jgi:hypothetical protein
LIFWKHHINHHEYNPCLDLSLRIDLRSSNVSAPKLLPVSMRML